MATEKPKKYGIQSEAWTHWELVMTANREGITSAVSRSTVGRILAEANIKPHRSKYWEFPNIKELDIFNERVAEISAIYRNAEKNLKQ